MQLARLEKYCRNKRLNIIRTCSFDESAYTNNRSELDLIIDFIFEQKEKIAVCCDKVDRLTRNLFDKRISLLYEKALKDEIELHFVSDGQIITSQISAVEKFQFSMSLGLAKYFSDSISDNVRRAMEQKIRKGEWLSKAPYGYKNITKEDGTTDVILDEYAAHIVNKAFELYATGAFSLAMLCNKLKGNYGVDWSISYIDKVFNNPFYHGMMRIKDKVYPHRYPPIVLKTLFEQVQQVKGSFNKKRSKFGGPAPFLYRGILRCADCGLAITPEKHKGFVYYHCTQYNGKHGAEWFREEVITEKLGAIFKKLQMPKEILKHTIATLGQVHQDKIEFQKKQYEKLIQEHKTLSTMMDNLYIDKLKERITESAYDKFYTSFRDKITEINIKIDELQEADDNYYTTAKLY